MLGQFGQMINAAGSVTPEDVQPTFDAPWMALLGTAGGWAAGTALVALVIVIIIGALMFAGGKLGNSGRGQDMGISWLIWGLVAVVLVGAAGGVVAWASGLPLGF